MAKYGIFLTPDLHHVVAMKTTVATPADGDWDNQDNAIIPAGNSPIKSMWAVEDGSDIHVATQQKNGRVAYHVFDPGTDAWTIRDEQVIVVGDTNFTVIPPEPSVTLVVRSDGDVVLSCSEDDGCLFIIRTAGTWASAINGDIVGIPGCAVIDSSDHATFIYSSSTSLIRGVRITATDTLETSFSIDATSDTATLRVGPGVIDSANLISVPYIDASDDVSVAQFTSAVAPSPINLRTDVSDLAVLGNGATVPPFVVACLALDGTQPHLLYADAATADLWHDDNASVSGGGTETEIENTVTANRVSCKKGTSDILYFFDDAGAPDFGVVTLAAGPNITVPLKTFTRAQFTPGIASGVNVFAPAPKAYNLAEQTPAVGTSVLITAPAPKAYNRTDFAPTVETGVTIITPLGGFTRTDFTPGVASGVNVFAPVPKAYTRTGFAPTVTISTPVNIIVPAPKAYTLAKLLPTIETGVTIIVPAPKAYSLSGFDPTIETGVTIIVPAPKAYSLNGFDPAISIGVNIVMPAPKAYSLTGFDPVINIGVNIITPLGTFTRTGFAPAVAAGAINIIVPLKTFTRTNFLPGVASGVNIDVPLGTFTRAGFNPLIATGVTIIVPSPKTFTLTGFDPAAVFEININAPSKKFNFTGFNPDIHSNRPPILAATVLDLTPPFDDIDQIRYLFRNFAVLRDLLETGIDGQFTTTDGKTALVRGGVIVDLF